MSKPAGPHGFEGRAALYRARAAEARDMAETARFDESRESFLKIARQWERLAARIEEQGA